MIKSIQELGFEPIDTQETIEKSWGDKDLRLVKFIDGKVSEIDLGKSKQVFIKHNRVKTQIPYEGEEGYYEEKEIDYAYCIICPKPVSYGKLINYAVHQEFSEENGEIEAINRKRFTNPDDPEIAIHDSFVNWVKEGLKEMGWNGTE